MDNKANETKYELKNCYYAKATFDEDGNLTYNTPKEIPDVVNLSLDVVSDGVIRNVTGELETAHVPESFVKDILHEEDNNGVFVVESSDVETEHFTLFFEVNGDGHDLRLVVYDCSCTSAVVADQTRTALFKREVAEK